MNTLDTSKKLVRYIGKDCYPMKHGEVLYFKEISNTPYRMTICSNMQGHVRYALESELEVLGLNNKLT